MVRISKIYFSAMTILFGGIIVGDPTFAAQVAYSYDALGRLIEATYDNGTDVFYSYDSAGNRTNQVVYKPAVAPTVPTGNVVSLTDYTPSQCQFTQTADGGLTAYCQRPDPNNSSQTITLSETFLAAAQLNFANNTTLFAVNSDQAAIARLYRTAFSTQTAIRNPDMPGLAFYYGLYYALPPSERLNPAAGMLQPLVAGSTASMIDYFMASDEYKTPYGSVDDSTFVQAMYRNALGRVPCTGVNQPIAGCTTDELGFWTGEIASGVTRAQVISFISNSTEAISDALWSGTAGWIILEKAAGV